MLETLVNVNAGVNQLNTGISKSISTKNAQVTNSINRRQVHADSNCNSWTELCNPRQL